MEGVGLSAFSLLKDACPQLRMEGAGLSAFSLLKDACPRQQKKGYKNVTDF